MKTRITDTNPDLGLDLAKLLGGAAAGALLMYMLDPDRGGARRAQSAAAVRTAGTRTSGAIGNVWRGAGARLGAVTEDAREGAEELADAAKPEGGLTSSLSRIGQAAGGIVDDTVAKARSVAGRASELASEVAGNVADGAAARAGSVLDKTGAADLASRITSRANRAGKVVSERIGEAGTRVRGAVQDTDWRASLHNPSVIGGGLLGLYGLARRSPLGLVLGLAGAALLARGLTGQPLRSLVSGRKLGESLSSSLTSGLSPTIDFEKSIHIEAAPEAVYDVWTNYENFPRFMSHVAEVSDLGRRRSHWVVKGPGGTEFAWNSVLTEQSRPHRLAWRSEPGAEIPQSGSIQFERHRGGTHVTVRMSYTPPAGVLGHGLATLLGADPKARMDDDLARMKAFIERGGVPRGTARPSSFSRLLH